MQKMKRCRQQGMTISELLVGISIFSMILAISLGLINRWMNISRLSDLQAQAIGEGREAIVEMARDIRKSELIMTNTKLSMSYTKMTGVTSYSLQSVPPSPYPSFGENLTSPIPLVTIDTPSPPPAGFVTKSPLESNSIALVYTDSYKGNTVKGYVVYYTGDYKDTDGINKVGLFRYSWVDNSNKYKFSQTSTKLADLLTASISTVVLGSKTEASPVPDPLPPKLVRLVTTLHFAHSPGYTQSGSLPAKKYLFRIYNLHPYSRETWMSPFYVDIDFTVVAPEKSMKEVELMDEKKLHAWAMRTIAFAKNVYLPLKFGDPSK